MKNYRPTWVEISKAAFAHNVALAKKKAGSGVGLLAVLKADAYGHGAETLAPLALSKGASVLGVSSLEEGLALRQSGILAPILLLGGIFPLENFSVAIGADLTPTVSSFQAVRTLRQLALRGQKRIPFHLKVDTGMGRIGVSVEEAKRILMWIQGKGEIFLKGIYSHLSSADIDASFTRKQCQKFDQLKQATIQMGLSNVCFHLANSAGFLFGRSTFHDMVRLGLLLYGVSPMVNSKSWSFSPVLSWKTKVVFLKTVPKGTPISYGHTFVTKRRSRIATLPVGYADGIPRLVSNKAMVLIKNQRRPVIGLVTMDHIMLDVTGVNVSIGEPVVLIGRQGRESITATDWAEWAQTNAYEIFCGISKRVLERWSHEIG